MNASLLLVSDLKKHPDIEVHAQFLTHENFLANEEIVHRTNATSLINIYWHITRQWQLVTTEPYWLIICQLWCHNILCSYVNRLENIIQYWILEYQQNVVSVQHCKVCHHQRRERPWGWLSQLYHHHHHELLVTHNFVCVFQCSPYMEIIDDWWLIWMVMLADNSAHHNCSDNRQFISQCLTIIIFGRT